jgi:hypothetical protein
MKEFWVYTASRLGLFVVSYAIILGIWMLAAGSTHVPMLWPFALAVVISAVGSLFLLRRQRDRFAARVEQRASRMTANVNSRSHDA